MIAIISRIGLNLHSYRSIEKVHRTQHDILERSDYSASVFTKVPGLFGGFGYEHVSPVRFRYILEHCVVAGRSGTLFKDGKVISESNSWPPQQVIYDFFLHSRTSRRLRVDGPVAVLPQTSYYHWLIEDMPAFIGALGTFPTPRVLTHRSPPKYVADFIERHLEEEPLYFRHSIAAKSTIFVGKTGIIGVPQPKDVEVVRDYFSVHAAESKMKKMIYISRLNSKRSPKGERMLVAALKNIGVETIEAESMALHDQVSLFKECNVVIGPHGAGLTNMVFMGKGLVIELMEPGWPNACFEILAERCGHDFMRFELPDGITSSVVDEITRLCSSQEHGV